MPSTSTTSTSSSRSSSATRCTQRSPISAPTISSASGSSPSPPSARAPTRTSTAQAYPSLEETGEKVGYSFADLCRLRNETLPAFVERWATEIDWSEYDVVGFTSTFEQNVAALALARRLKERHPGRRHRLRRRQLRRRDGAGVRARVRLDRLRRRRRGRRGAAGDRRAHRARRESAAGLPGVVARVDDGVVRDGAAPLVQRPRRAARPGLRRVLRHARAARPGAGARQRDAAASLRERARLLVGREAPLHLLRPERARHGVPLEVARARPRRAPAPVGPATRSSTSRPSTTSSTCATSSELCRPLIEERVDYRLFYEVKANLKRAQLRTLVARGRRRDPARDREPEHARPEADAQGRDDAAERPRAQVGPLLRHHGRAGTCSPASRARPIEDYEAQARLIAEARAPAAAGGRRPDLDGALQPVLHRPAFPVERARAVGRVPLRLPEDRVDLRKIAYFFDYTMGDTVPDEELVGREAGDAGVAGQLERAGSGRSSSTSAHPTGSR